MCRYVILKRGPAEAAGVSDLPVVSICESEGDARKTAEELAEADSTADFLVFQHIGTAALEPRVVWKGAKP